MRALQDHLSITHTGGKLVITIGDDVLLNTEKYRDLLVEARKK